MSIKNKRIGVVDVVIRILLCLLGLIILYPFYNCILISLMKEKEYIRVSFAFFPKEITFESYRYILSYPKIATGYISILNIILIGIPYNMLLTICTAYGLSRKPFPGKKAIMILIIFTMYFSGGIIPLYLLVKSLGLMDHLLSVVLVYGVNTFYMLIIKNYFESIPESIEESAKIDGANEFYILFKIMIPLSMPIIATFLLFFLVDRWNEWYSALLFIRSSSKWPLQLVLREVINNTGSEISNALKANRASDTLLNKVFSQGIKMAAIVITMAPIMLVYPFVQKYFIKGILIGSVKS